MSLIITSCCKICNITFPNVGSFAEHVAIHHSPDTTLSDERKKELAKGFFGAAISGVEKGIDEAKVEVLP